METYYFSTERSELNSTSLTLSERVSISSSDKVSSRSYWLLKLLQTQTNGLARPLAVDLFLLT